MRRTPARPPAAPGRRRLSRTAAAGPAAALGLLALAVSSAAPASAAPAGAPSGPPPVTILTPNADHSRSDFFISPFGDQAAYQNGAEILSPDGKKVIWFHPALAGEEDSDFRTQTYDGKPS